LELQRSSATGRSKRQAIFSILDSEESSESAENDYESKEDEDGGEGDGRLLSKDAFTKFSETLGALNTVGRYIVNITKGQEPSLVQHNQEKENVPDAILTLTKNVLGKNITKSIEPLIKKVGGTDVELSPDVSTTSAEIVTTTTTTVAPSAGTSLISISEPLLVSEAPVVEQKETPTVEHKKKKRQKIRRKDDSSKKPVKENKVEASTVASVSAGEDQSSAYKIQNSFICAKKRTKIKIFPS
jgi:hypothetical protein